MHGRISPTPPHFYTHAIFVECLYIKDTCSHKETLMTGYKKILIHSHESYELRTTENTINHEAKMKKTFTSSSSLSITESKRFYEEHVEYTHHDSATHSIGSAAIADSSSNTSDLDKQSLSSIKNWLITRFPKFLSRASIGFGTGLAASAIKQTIGSLWQKWYE